jgi:glycosyltransferase involved in cell wall biosynthesis
MFNPQCSQLPQETERCFYTVAICTHHRHDLLRTTLASLAKCDAVARPWEALVVDNGCEEEVYRIVQSFAGALPVRYAQERHLGTSWARNRAVHEARGGVIIFTDDDVTFDPAWLTRIVGAVEQHGGCDFWGGSVEPVWPDGAPNWFDVKRCPLLGDAIVRYQRGDRPRYWDPDAGDPPFYTANLAIRKERIERAGYFNTDVGHRGDVRMGMEDSLMVLSIHHAGGRGWYAADAVVRHPVPQQRLTKRFVRGFAWRQGWLSSQLHRQNGRAPRWFYRAAASGLGKALSRSFLGLAQRDGAEWSAGQAMAVFNLSKLWHALGPSASLAEAGRLPDA